MEFAIVAPAALLLLFGTVEFGRWLQARSALQFAVEEAARCGAVDKTKCGNAEAIKAYAASRVLGQTVQANKFTTTQEVCGRRVTGNLPWTLNLPDPLPSSKPITATACYPT